MQSNLEGLYFFSSCSRLTHPEKAHFRRDKIILNKNCCLKGKMKWMKSYIVTRAGVTIGV